METVTVDAPVIGKQPSFEELTSMVQGTKPEKPETKTTEPEAKPAEDKTPPADPVTAKDKQQEDIEEELPENVKKRIEREAKKQAFFQSKIDQAVSARKAKEAEAAKLTGETGSEPAKTTEPAKTERPKRPDLATYKGTLAEYNAELSKYDDALEKWLESRTRDTFQRELKESQAKEAQAREWDAATKKHGAEFPQMMSALAAKIPVGLQEAISALDDWSTVAVHLAKNEDERSALATEFEKSPVAAIAKLGKLEDRLTTAATKPSTKEDKQIPAPLKPVGGGASGSSGKADLQKASTGEMLAELDRMVKASSRA